MKHNIQKIGAIIIPLLLFSLASLAGGPGEIKGKVFDEFKQPMIGTTVWVEIGDRIIGTTTDIDGKYTLKPLDAGVYNVQLSFVGYTKKVISSVRVSSDKITFLEDQHMTIGVELEGVTVVAWEEKLIDPENPLLAPITAKQLQKLPSSRSLVNSVATMMGGVYQSDADQPLYFRGSRSNASAYFVDGVKTFGSDMGVPSASVGEIIVYSSGIPAKYGDVTGGIIAVETKSYFSVYNELEKERKRNEILGK